MRRIQAQSGQTAKVSDGDYSFLSQFKWWVVGSDPSCKPYFVTNLNGKTFYMHRVITGAESGTEVDHINGDPADNRRSNLRLATRQQNCVNRRNYAPSSGYRGVYRDISASRWRVRISVNGENIHGGMFDCKEEAARRYDEMAKEHFGDFAILNFPEEEQ